MSGKYNKQAIIVKNLVDEAREQQEMVKYMFYTVDNSEGAKLLMKDTAKKGFFKARYLNSTSLKTRNKLFKGN